MQTNNLPQHTEKVIPGGTAILIEPSSQQEMRAAIVEINGNYPDEGSVGINEGKTELLFMIDGHITVTKDMKTYSLEKHDVLYLEPGIPYSIVGNATVFVAIAPGDAPSTKIISQDE
ncbi:hypothetical protein KC573_02610 [candidate division WWE3 bacterium]|uniref:Uncharacterized protein n=1 Tax=candidate division WWE3 bacterium TaxID=2053526 RepID=A0A955LW05_UNCKA|nr:hypothetical protein [candidate division WWE3 bacterium]